MPRFLDPPLSEAEPEKEKIVPEVTVQEMEASRAGQNRARRGEDDIFKSCAQFNLPVHEIGRIVVIIQVEHVSQYFRVDVGRLVKLEKLLELCT